MSASIGATAKGIEDQLESMVGRSKLLAGYLARVVYPTYQNAQRERWKSENSGEDFSGYSWHSLDPAYAAYKKKKYADQPGSGTKIMIRTKRLFDSVVGPSPDHGVIIDAHSIRVNTSVPYAEFAGKDRTFSQFSPRFFEKIMVNLMKYMAVEK